MVRAILAALFALALSLPAAAQIYFVPNIQTLPPAQIGNTDKVSTVAVLSAIGVKMTLENVNFWSLTGAKSKSLDISEWKIDEQAEAMVRLLLGSRFTFKDVAYDRAALARLPNGSLTNSRAAVRQLLQKIERADLDAFIVIRPDLEYNVPGEQGLALVTDRGPPILWANYEVDVVDARTLETISRAYSRVQPRLGAASFAGIAAGGTGIEMSDELNPTEAQRAQLKAGLLTLVPASLLATLRDLKLSDAIPPVGARAIAAIPPSEDTFKDIKTVAVVSGVADTLVFAHQGFASAATTTQVNIGDWGFNEKLEQQVRAILRDRFVIKDVSVDREKLASARLVDDNGAFNPSLAGLSVTDEVDAYVLLVKHPRLKIGTTRIEGAGIGVQQFSALGSSTSVFANYDVALVTAKDLKVAAGRRATLSPRYPSATPARDVENATWPKAPPVLAPEQQAKVSSTLAEILTDSIEETLLQMRLTGKMIADSWVVASPIAQ